MRLPYSQRIEAMRRQLTPETTHLRKHSVKPADVGGHQNQMKALANAAASNRVLIELNPLSLGVELIEEALEEAVESAAIDSDSSVDDALSGGELLAAMAMSEIGAAGEIMAHVIDEAIYSGGTHFNSW
jgi:hypothetical protein